jgi:hypothetical protein
MRKSTCTQKNIMSFSFGKMRQQKIIYYVHIVQIKVASWRWFTAVWHLFFPSWTREIVIKITDPSCFRASERINPFQIAVTRYKAVSTDRLHL